MDVDVGVVDLEVESKGLAWQRLDICGGGGHV